MTSDEWCQKQNRWNDSYRGTAWSGFVEGAYGSIGGSPWSDDVEAALETLRIKMDQAIDASPVLKEIFDRAVPPHPPISEER
jgi:hypothetical protein